MVIEKKIIFLIKFLFQYVPNKKLTLNLPLCLDFILFHTMFGYTYSDQTYDLYIEDYIFTTSRAFQSFFVGNSCPFLLLSHSPVFDRIYISTRSTCIMCLKEIEDKRLEIDIVPQFDVYS